ncbi:MAG TPA: magnesium transporter CorA family protein [Fontimonas sp.]
MDLHHFVNGHRAQCLAADAPIPKDGFIWADIERGEAAEWAKWAEARMGLQVDPQHVEDSLNPRHPSFFDHTTDYDMLIFEGLGPKDEPFPIETRVAAFFMFERVLVTVRAVDNVSILRVRERVVDGRLKCPGSPLRLAFLIIDTMVDRYMRIRAPMDQHLTALQDDLLDTKGAEHDWRDLLGGRREARRLEALCERQIEALESWHRNSRFDWKQVDEVRHRNITEHVGRVLAHSSGLERDLEAAVQLHFAAVAYRTNRVMQALTVLSAIFFPLTFIVGVYGMNFENMPELRWHYGYYGVLALLAVIALSLILYFKRKRLF